MRDDTIQDPDSGKRQRAWHAVGGGVQLRARHHQQPATRHEPKASQAICGDLYHYAIAGQSVLARPGRPHTMTPPFEAAIRADPNRIAIFDDGLRDVATFVRKELRAAVDALLDPVRVADRDPN